MGNRVDVRDIYLIDANSLKQVEKFAGIFGLNVQDVGAQQTGMSVDAFKAKLAAAGSK